MKDNRDKLFIVLIITTLIFSLFTIYVYSESEREVRVSAKAAALYDPTDQTFLYLKNGHERLPMASTTKIMTAIVAIENCELDKIVTVDERAVGIEGSSVYLKVGEEISVESLLYALMLRSANDAAAAIAYDISGSIEAFSSLMNEKAASLGLANTSFENPHGLDSKNHYTSAHDLAIISAYAISNPIFREICSSKKKIIDSSSESRLLINHNKLLNLYEGCIGIKTGYTKKSGRSLASASDKYGHTLICVTIDAPDDWNDHKLLFDYGFMRLSV